MSDSFKAIETQQRNLAASNLGYVLVTTGANVQTKYPGLTGVMARSILNFWVKQAAGVMQELFRGAVRGNPSSVLSNENLQGSLANATAATGRLLNRLASNGQLDMPRITAPDTREIWNTVDNLAMTLSMTTSAPDSWDFAGWAVKSATNDALAAAANLPGNILNFFVPLWLRVGLIGLAGLWAYNKFVKDSREHE